MYCIDRLKDDDENSKKLQAPIVWSKSLGLNKQIDHRNIWTDSGMLRCKLENGLEAIFKPLRSQALCGALFCYRLARFLEIEAVPPLVPKIHSNQQGILQLYIEGEEDHEETPDFSERERLFLFLSGMTDLVRNNRLIEQRTGYRKFIDYDSASMMHKVTINDYPFIKEDSPSENRAPQLNAQDLRQFPYDRIEVFSPNEIELFRRGYSDLLSKNRLDHLIFNLTNQKMIDNKLCAVRYKQRAWVQRNRTIMYPYTFNLVNSNTKEILLSKNFDEFGESQNQYMTHEMKVTWLDRISIIRQAHGIASS